MRIWRQHELGEPAEVLTVETVDDPEPGPGEVLVAVDAVGLSFPDVLMARGEYQVPTRLPHTPGGETAGRVVAHGEGVDAPALGTPVVVLGGGLAESVVVPAAAVHPYPADVLTPVKAAALPVNYGTAYYALFERARLVAGEWLLVTGAAGGTGSAAIQLARTVDARVVAVVGGERKAALVSDLGAYAVIDHHRTPEWVDIVRDVTGGGVDVAFDPVGGETSTQVRRSMGWDGRLLVIGFVAGIPQIPANHVLLKNYSVVGVHWGASLARDPAALGRQLTALFDLARLGLVDPPLYPPRPFEEAAGALQDLAERRVWAKVVVEVAGRSDS